jgi:Tol biopolymer transport system component
VRIALGILIGLAVSVAVQGASGASAALREFGLYQIRTDGTARTRILNNPDIHEVGELSPDRTRFLFQYARSQPPGLYSAALDGSDVRLVASLPEQRGIKLATWSHGGSRIAIEAYDLSPCRPSGTNCAVGEIWLAKANGTALRRLARRAIAPAWSPDSRRIAYIGSFNAYSGTGALTAGNTRGALRPRRLGPIEYGSGDSWGLTWSPRGDQIGYTTFDAHVNNTDERASRSCSPRVAHGGACRCLVRGGLPDGRRAESESCTGKESRAA